MNNKVRFIVHAAVIAAIYVVLTYFISAFNLASGAIQVRISEALCILPFFTPAAIPGLYIGCLLSNILTGCALWDIIFGSLATLIGAVGSYLIATSLKHNTASRFLVPLPPILANTVIIPFVLAYVYGLLDTEIWGFNASIPLLMLTVGIGEVLSIYVLGEILLHALLKPAPFIFNNGKITRSTESKHDSKK